MVVEAIIIETSYFNTYAVLMMGTMGRLYPVVICLCGGWKLSLNREGEDFRFALQIFLSEEIFYPLSGEK